MVPNSLKTEAHNKTSWTNNVTFPSLNTHFREIMNLQKKFTIIKIIIMPLLFLCFNESNFLILLKRCEFI